MRLSRVRSLGLTLALGSLLLTGCGSGASSDDRPSIAAAFGPLAWVAQQIAGEEFQVQNLTSSGAEAHDISLGIGQVSYVEKADLVLILKGFQPAVDQAAANVAEGSVLDAADFVDLEPLDDRGHEEEPGHGGHDGHDHGRVDPHFWQDPLRMALLADAVAQDLAQRHPDAADLFTQRATALRTELESLDEAYRVGLTGCARDTVVVSHEAFDYLAKYGLKFEAINGLSPGAEPSPQDLARLQQLIVAEGITTVFSEARATQKLAATLAKDTGVRTAVLDPLEILADGPQGDYVSMMETNLDALRTANGC